MLSVLTFWSLSKNCSWCFQSFLKHRLASCYRTSFVPSEAAAAVGVGSLHIPLKTSQFSPEGGVREWIGVLLCLIWKPSVVRFSSPGLNSDRAWPVQEVPLVSQAPVRSEVTG